MSDIDFHNQFLALTDHAPMPWQKALYERFIREGDSVPSCCDIPTGLGKTSVIAIWLIALGNVPKIPRRLVYVVNRRTVVDQTTDEVEKIRQNLDTKPELQSLRQRLGALAISTLRGQFADNQEWSADPSRPAVICGTVDMIGSRLLFSGYRIGFKSKPLHAGFLGQDALLVHDEAHLEPAFQTLIETIQAEQEREVRCAEEFPCPKFQVMALSATARQEPINTNTLKLSAEDHKHPVVKKRVHATKQLTLHSINTQDEKRKDRTAGKIDEDVIGKIVERTQAFSDSNLAILVFSRKVDDVEKIVKKLPKGSTKQLTGTLRGLERDELVKTPVFQRFLPASNRDENVTPAEGTVYLVCTSAGEVGVNMSADHLVCDLSTFDSMAQRFGRVNRFGDRDDTEIHIVHPDSLGKKDKNGSVTVSEFDERRQRTLGLLRQLVGDASPQALDRLDAKARTDAFSPEPTILPASDILFDAWSLTTIRDKMPGRPPVAPYLHGITEWDPPQTQVAWRHEIDFINDEFTERFPPNELLEDYPLKPHELLRDQSSQVLDKLQTLANLHMTARVWLVDADGTVTSETLGSVANPAAKGPQKKALVQAIDNSTVLLPPSVGGLSGGLLDGKAKHDPNVAYDVADEWLDEKGRQYRVRLRGDIDPPDEMALIRTIDTNPNAAEFESDSGETENNTDANRFWYWYIRPRAAEDITRASTQPIRLEYHTGDVVTRTRQIVSLLQLDDELQQALVLAAELHDLGKRRELFQRSIGNPNPSDKNWYAKPGKPKNEFRWRPRRISTYRHEFGSLLDILSSNAEQEQINRFRQLDDELQDLVLHVIAAHHGRARPHFPPNEAIDPAPGHADHASEQTLETPRRFARLQRRYGRWGLAYLESLLRAADWAASAEPSEFEEDDS